MSAFEGTTDIQPTYLTAHIVTAAALPADLTGTATAAAESRVARASSARAGGRVGAAGGT
jgi:hypothetical protein